MGLNFPYDNEVDQFHCLGKSLNGRLAREFPPPSHLATSRLCDKHREVLHHSCLILSGLLLGDHSRIGALFCGEKSDRSFQAIKHKFHRY